jgi:hypothetical protein
MMSDTLQPVSYHHNIKISTAKDLINQAFLIYFILTLFFGALPAIGIFDL